MPTRFTVFKDKSWRVNMRGWPFVIVVGLILALIAILDGGGLSGARSTGAAGAVAATSCSFTVNATDVQVRSDASTASAPVEKLNLGQAVVGTPTLTNGFRRLETRGWVSDTFLTPVVGTTCA